MADRINLGSKMAATIKMADAVVETRGGGGRVVIQTKIDKASST